MDAPLTVLHLGCGRKKTLADIGLVLQRDGHAVEMRLINLDSNPDVAPDILCRLGLDPITLEDDSVDLAIAHHVIEHIGAAHRLEEWWGFWAEVYRVLKPQGQVLFECPYHTSVWAWADPTHCRGITEYTFLYLNQDAYRCGGSIPDYRPPCDFVVARIEKIPDRVNADVRALEPISMITGTLVARKPLRPYWIVTGKEN